MVKKLLTKIRSFFKSEEPAEIHLWNLVAKTYAAPRPNLNIPNLPQFTLEKVLFGVTTYVWECTLTGDVKTKEVLGSDENELTTVLEKAKREMQYVNYGDERFGIALVPKDIPVK